MEFITATEAAARMGVTVRAVQKWAKSGRILGAKQMGRSWLIPADAQLTESTVRAQESNPQPTPKPSTAQRKHFPFPLLNTSFEPGSAWKVASSMEDEDDRAIALGEYHYFCGECERSAQELEPYLRHDDPCLAISANLIYLFDSLSLGKTLEIHETIEYIRQRASRVLTGESDPLIRASAVLLGTTASVLLRSPEVNVLDLERVLFVLPRPVQFFGCYILSYYAYLQHQYERSLTIAEIALALGGEHYPIALNYLRTMLCIDLMCLRRVEEAKKCFSELWETVKKDNGTEVIGQHYLMMQGLPDICLKRQKPDDFKQLLEVTKRFGQSWRRMQEQVFKKYHAKGLTLTESNIASLYNRGWAVKEISLHMDISERMVKHHIAMIYEKLGISNREELRKLNFG